ncbi:MAG: metabolite traffic protein EboE [Acidobacteria bacterium]|nr:metabolite traffic protein EboE [Acidobacteriota bacterium]
MRDVFGPGTILGYCTNVHAGASLPETVKNLEQHTLAVKARVSPNEPMGVGLWLAARAARDLLAEPEELARFRDWLWERGLEAFTLNGFPYGDFHGREVKYRVYEPDWRDPERLRYTLDLARIQATLRPAGAEGSISTLPVGWRASIAADASGVERAAGQLRDLADELARIEDEQGQLIHVDLEPEPGCYLDKSSDVVEFFEQHLLGDGNAGRIRRHLRVCHDICHSAVMFEPDRIAFENYARAGIEVGKVQISCAVRARFDLLDGAGRKEMMRQLGEFAEDRYLHQTVIRGTSGEQTFHDDLPALLSQDTAGEPAGEWRIHFHVPLYLASFGLLETTQQQVAECLAAVQQFSAVRHFEAETYAWSVLPSELRVDELAVGIAHEVTWLRQRFLVPSTA